VQKADKLRASGVNLIDFGAGEPDFPTPDHIKHAGYALWKKTSPNTTHRRYAELKEALVDRHAKDFGSR